ncbi:MAG TPA: dihydroorotate dehydrogenase [Firmicutes bacterium]|nr:dihydroorotate dehydrogenase [Bacillota bacterium]
MNGTSGIEVEVAGLKLRTPLIACSGCAGFGSELKRIGALEGLGALCLKGLTLEPRSGNTPPRLWEMPSGLLNSIGLENPGAQKVLGEILPGLDLGIPLIANIAGNTYEEFARLAYLLDSVPVEAIEVNVSCPNVEEGGRIFGADPESVYKTVSLVRGSTRKKLFVKLSVACQDVADVAMAAEEAGADALSLINTVPAMAIDPITLKPALGNVSGGLSGPAIKPIALLAVWKVYRVTRLPIIGMGGVATAQDVLEFMAAGASCVGLGSQLLRDPYSPARIAGELVELRKRLNKDQLKEIVGCAHGGTSGSTGCGSRGRGPRSGTACT